MNLPIEGNSNSLLPFLLMMSMNENGLSGLFNSGESTQNNSVLNNHEMKCDEEKDEHEMHIQREKTSLVPETNKFGILNEIVPYLPTQHKKRLYSVFAIQDMLNKIQSPEYEYEALSNEVDGKEKNRGLMEFLLNKMQIPQIKNIRSMMDNVNNLKNTISMLGGISNLQQGRLADLLKCFSSNSNNSNDDYDVEPEVEVASYKKTAPSTNKLLNKQQRNSLVKMLNSVK